VSLRVDRKKHGAFEAVPQGENFGELRETFLGAVFLITSQKDEFFAQARAGFPFEDQGVGGESCLDCEAAEKQEDKKAFHVSAMAVDCDFQLITARRANVSD
jgi:hypothetical protein